MRALDEPAAHFGTARHHAHGSQFLQQQRHRGDVAEGVGHTHFMEMDFRDGTPVRLRLGIRDQIVHRLHMRLHGVRRIERRDLRGDVRPRGVMMMVMVRVIVVVVVTRLVVVMMVVVVLFLGVSVDVYVHARTDKTAHGRGIRMYMYAGYAERVDARQRGRTVGNQLKERGGEHVTGRAHRAFEVERLHYVRRQRACGGARRTRARRTRRVPPRG